MRARAFVSRKSERGAAVFIVVMVITLLTAIGIFAARSASLTDVAAGFEREAAQTSLMTQFASNAVATELGGGMATTYLQVMKTKPETCQANTGLPTSPLPPCYRFFKSDLDSRTLQLGGETLLDSTTLSSTGGLQADFMVELTDPGPAGAPIVGSDVGGTGSAFHYVSVTLSTTALIMPALAACGPADSIGQQKARAVVVVGPVAQ